MILNTGIFFNSSPGESGMAGWLFETSVWADLENEAQTDRTTMDAQTQQTKPKPKLTWKLQNPEASIFHV